MHHMVGQVLPVALLLGLAAPLPAASAARTAPLPLYQVAPPLRDLYAGAPLTPHQTLVLRRLANQTWAFFLADPDPATGLPRDNLGFHGQPPVGAFTSPTDVALYLWGVTAATQLGLTSPSQGYRLAKRVLSAVGRLPKWHGFLLSWYDTTTGQPLSEPGGRPLRATRGAFVSTVDNGWYASALIVVRQAFPRLAPQATALLDAMNFGVFDEPGNESTDPTAGQLARGYVVGQGPTAWTYGNLNTDPRIAIYVGIGTGTVPGAAWWRTWRTLPAYDRWQTQVPRGFWQRYRDPDSHQVFRVFEGHDSYDGIRFVPSWGGSAFEALMAPLVVPEAAWGVHSFAINAVNYAEASIAYAGRLGYPVWGLSPASVPGTHGAYATYGAYPLGSGGRANAYADTAVAPYASFLALPWIPQPAYRNVSRLMSRYHLLGPYGMYDAVDPTTGQVATRYLILDQGMILAGIDSALESGGLARYFARDPVGQRIRPYLREERFSITPAPGLRLHWGSPAAAESDAGTAKVR